MVISWWLIWSVCLSACIPRQETREPTLNSTHSTIVATPLEGHRLEHALAPADPRLVPAPLPSRDNIKAAQRSTRFGVVKVAYGSGPRGQSGYAMLFERRGNRWVFLCVILSWIS